MSPAASEVCSQLLFSPRVRLNSFISDSVGHLLTINKQKILSISQVKRQYNVCMAGMLSKEMGNASVIIS